MRISTASKNGDHSTAIISLLLILSCLIQQSTACHRVYFDNPKLQNIACQCNSTHCDQLPEFQWPLEDDAAFVRLVSDRQGRRFELSELRVATEPQVNHNNNSDSQMKVDSISQPLDYDIEVLINLQHQQVVGFGGAFTDSASLLLQTLEPEVRAKALEDYFGSKGLGYSVGRVPIGGTDMSTRPYTYDDLNELAPGSEDLELRHFRLQPEDHLYKMPLIRAANEVRAERQLEPLKLMAASWSAPAWMKSNHNVVQGRLRGNSTSGPYYDAYARYLVRFLDEYERHNLSMWALSAQNEPHTPKRVGPVKINFNSVNFEPEEMADYLANSLVPALTRANWTRQRTSGSSALQEPEVQGNRKPLKLFMWDDTLDGLSDYQTRALEAPNVAGLSSGLGLAIHWYATGLREQPYWLLHEARRKLPDQYCMMSTEASFIGRPRPGEWARGERYARDIIENLRVGSVGWMDWNLALDTSGGPTWSNNILDSAILVQNSSSYLKNPMFYALGHLSRFVLPQSRIVHSQALPVKQSADSFQLEELSVVAAEMDEPARTSGRRELKRRIGLVILNRAKSTRRVRLRLRDCKLKQKLEPLELELTPSSLTSLAYAC